MITVKRSGSLLKLLAERAANPQGLLKQFGAFIRAEAQDRIASGEGMAPWADSTRRKYEAEGTGAITSRARVRLSYARKLSTYLKRTGAEDAREQLRKLYRGGRVEETTSKPIERLQKRLDRARKTKAKGGAVNVGKTKAERRSVLGQLVKTFSSKLRTKTRIAVVNYAGFSAVQNDGGQVGNGSTLPSRKFLEVTERARRWMAQKTIDYLLRE